MISSCCNLVWLWVSDVEKVGGSMRRRKMHWTIGVWASLYCDLRKGNYYGEAQSLEVMQNFTFNKIWSKLCSLFVRL